MAYLWPKYGPHTVLPIGSSESLSLGPGMLHAKLQFRSLNIDKHFNIWAGEREKRSNQESRYVSKETKMKSSLFAQR